MSEWEGREREIEEGRRERGREGEGTKERAEFSYVS